MNQKDTRKKLICELVDDKLYVPMKEKELAVFLQKPEETYVNGTFIGNQKGFGFLEVEGCAEDLFIPESRVGGAFPGDTVQARVVPGRRGKRQEAEVVKVLERNMRQIVGTFQNHGSFGFVLPDDIRIISDVFVPGERSKGAVNGQKVVVEITDYGAPGKNPEGIVTEILGHAEDPGVDILSVIKAYDLPVEFPERVLNQAGRANHPVSEADMAGRLDLRDLDMVTIDGEDAKDLDDAVSLTMEGDLYCLGDSDAAPCPFQWDLFPECRRGQTGFELYHENQRERTGFGLSDHRNRDSCKQAHVLYCCQQNIGRKRFN